MKKLLCLVLIALILGSISATVESEWANAKDTFGKVKAFLQKYGLYDDLVKFFNDSAKGGAQLLCVKVFKKEGLCKEIINVLWYFLDKYL